MRRQDHGRDTSSGRWRTDFFVAPQLVAADFAAARAAGIRTVINNRPDGEAPDQLTDAEARELAAANGLDYVFVPVVSGGMGPDDVAAFAAGDRRASRPPPRLLPLRHALLPHVGVRHGRRAAGRRDARGRRRRRLRPDADPPDPGASRRRLSVRPRPEPGTVPRRPAPAAGRTAPRSPRAAAAARTRASASPSSAAISTSQGRLSTPSQAPAAASSLASPRPSPSRPRSRR